MSRINKSIVRNIASLNRQLKSIRTSAFIERENDDSKFVEPIGADSFNDALDGLESRVRVIKNKLDGRLLYDLSNKELDDIKESLNTLIEFTKDAKAKMSDQKSHSGSSKIPAEFKADEDQASWNKFYDKERSEAIKSEAYYKLKTKLASVDNQDEMYSHCMFLVGDLAGKPNEQLEYIEAYIAELSGRDLSEALAAAQKYIDGCDMRADQAYEASREDR